MSTFNDLVIESAEHRLMIILKAVREHEGLHYGDLQHVVEKEKPRGLSSTTFWRTLKDCKNMQLVKNGTGHRLTQVGEQFLNGINKREAYLNVPLFRECYDANPDVDDYEKIRNWFLPRLKDAEERMRGTIIRRYFEGLYPNIKIGKGQRVNIKPTISDFINNNIHSPTASPKSEGTTVYAFLRSHNLDHQQMLDVLKLVGEVNEKDRPEILRQLMQKM
ncbi:MAG: hypothetical protein V1735_03360 [Nanoarchaeota archaeon]